MDGRDLTQDEIVTLRGLACADVHWAELALLAAELGIAPPPSVAARSAARLKGYANPDDIDLVDLNGILTFLRSPDHRRDVRAQTTAKKMGREVIAELDKEITADVCSLAGAVGTSLGVRFAGVIVDVDRVSGQAVWLIFLPAHNGQPCPKALAAHSTPVPKRRLRKGEWPTKAVLEPSEGEYCGLELHEVAELADGLDVHWPEEREAMTAITRAAALSLPEDLPDETLEVDSEDVGIGDVGDV